MILLVTALTKETYFRTNFEKTFLKVKTKIGLEIFFHLRPWEDVDSAWVRSRIWRLKKQPPLRYQKKLRSLRNWAILLVDFFRYV